jgi:CRISPR/Cas system CSM-associated protein Csm3 (group 7 of RAMP superfamily)
MSSDRLNNRHQRNIYKRIIVKGTLVLDTPTCLGSGDADSLTDLALLRDSVDETKALLTGASIAGALRNYLSEYDQDLSLATLLFGADRQDDQGDQSPLIVYDAISNKEIDLELRDGVKIDGKTGTALPHAKYDFELLSAGTEFPLCLELMITEGDGKDESQIKQALAISLSGFEKGEIAIGMKKRRGFGRCHVKEWQVWEFDLKNAQHRLAWLTFDRDWAGKNGIHPKKGKVEQIFGDIGNDQRDRFKISATFSLIGSMLIRSAEYSERKTPDAVHLKSKRMNKQESIISGTSLTGVLRHRAVRIVKTLNPNVEVPEGKDRQPEVVEEIFGFVAEDEKRKNTPKAKSSRLVVREKVIENPIELVQTRIAIDRFTGGALHGALFDAQPVFGSDETRVTLELKLRKPEKYQIGLLLLLLKDLWTGDLPIGGESSIGRGRLQGINAEITYQKSKWTIQGKDRLTITPNGAQKLLEGYVKDLLQKVEAK